MRWIHIIAGLVSLASGAVALYTTKGSWLHRRSGLVFVIAMMSMTLSAVVIAAFLRPNAVNVLAGVLTFYLVATGLLTVREDMPHRHGWTAGFMLVALSMSVLALFLAFAALRSADGHVDGIPAPPLFLFVSIGLLGAIGDVRLLSAGKFHGAQRLGRHLWRMSLAMFIATASFFLGQARFFPESLRSRPLVLALPVLMVLAVMIYWLVRVRYRVRAISGIQD